MEGAFPADPQPSEVEKPGEGAFHVPPLPIACEVWLWATPGPGVPFPGDTGPYTPGPQPLPQGITVVALVRYHLSRPAPWATPGPGHPHCGQGRLCQPHFALLGALHQGPQGYPCAISHQHHFGSFAPSGQSHFLAPLLAGTKVASRKAWDQSSLLCSSRVERKARHIFSHTPWSCHSFRRRWQVESLPYFLGMSCQRAPERSTHRMPFNVRRSSARCRPRPLGGGSRGETSCHWASVRSETMAGPPVVSLSYSFDHSTARLISAPSASYKHFGTASR